jgi:hypothetical protein
MAESFERETAEGYTGPVNSEGKAVYGKRNPESVIEARQRRLYRQQQSGLSARALVYDHADRESIAVNTAWKDWKAVNKWNAEDFATDRADLVARLNAMRFRAINMALKKGQLQSAAQMMDSLGKAVGEGSEFTAQEDVKLNISIEKQGET